MRIILHTIWKDIILCRWVFIGLAFYYVANAFYLWQTAADVPPESVRMLAGLLFIGGKTAIPILVLGLVATIDPYPNSDAFHQTRPIAASKLFIAKLSIATVVVIGFPLITEIVLASLYGMFSKYMFVEAILWGSLYLGVFTIASASSSTVAAFKNLIICIVALGTLYGLFYSLGTFDYAPRELDDIGGLWSEPSMRAIERAFAGIAALSIGAFQFRTKRSRVSLGLVVCGAFAILIHMENGSNRSSFINPVIDSELRTEAIVSPVVSRDIDRKLPNNISGGYEKKDVLYAYLDSVQQLETDEIFPIFLNGSAQIDGVTIKPSYNRAVYRELPFGNYNFSKIAKVLGITQYLNSYGQKADTNRFPILDVTKEEQLAHEDSRAEYKGTVGLIRMRYLPVLRMPLFNSGQSKNVPYRGEVKNLIIDDSRIRFTGIFGYSYSVYDTASPYWHRLQVLAPKRNDLFLLVNKVTGEAIIPSAFSDRKSSLDYRRKQTEQRHHSTSSYNVEYHRPPSVDQNWLNQAEVVVIDKHIVNAEEINFEISNIKL